MIILLTSAGQSSWFCWQSVTPEFQNFHFRVVACESWMVQFFHTGCRSNFCWPFVDQSRTSWSCCHSLCGQRLSKNWILTLAANVQIRISMLPSFFGSLSSVTDRVSDTAVEVDGICSLRIAFCGSQRLESTFSGGVKGCGHSILDGGRWTDEQYEGSFRCLRALFSHFHGKSDCFDLPGITDCRCLRHFVLKKNRQLLCWQQLASHFLRLLGNYPLEASSWALPFVTVTLRCACWYFQFCEIRSCWTSRSCQDLRDLHCVTVAPSALDFPQPLFSVSCLKNLMFMQHVLLLTTWSVSCIGSNHLCRSFLSFTSIRPSYRCWAPWNSGIILTS